MEFPNQATNEIEFSMANNSLFYDSYPPGNSSSVSATSGSTILTGNDEINLWNAFPSGAMNSSFVGSPNKCDFLTSNTTETWQFGLWPREAQCGTSSTGHGKIALSKLSTFELPGAIELPNQGVTTFVFAPPELKPGESGRQIIFKPNPDSTLEQCLPVYQTPGQRCAGPPYGHVGPRPSADAELYVGQIPKNIYEDRIYGVFSCIGPIFQIRINTKGIHSRGYCYVQFYTKEAADSAIPSLNGYKFAGVTDHGPGIILTKTSNLTRLFVGGIPKLADQEVLRNQIKLSGRGNGLISIDIPKPVRSAENLGFCFFEYKDHLHALAGWELLLQSSPFVSWKKLNLVVNWALPGHQRPEDPQEIGTYSYHMPKA